MKCSRILSRIAEAATLTAIGFFCLFLDDDRNNDDGVSKSDIDLQNTGNL